MATFLPARKYEPTSPTQRYPIPPGQVGAPSLYQLCVKILIKHVNEIEDVGTNLDFRTVEPILIHVKHADQLRRIELESPQVAGQLPELWKAFIARDFGADPEKYVPSSPEKWHKVYTKHEREYEVAQDNAAAKLREQLSALNARKEKLKPKELSSSVAARLAPPRTTSWGWGRPVYGSGYGGGWGNNGDTWNAAIGSRTKDVMKRIKREVGNRKLKLTTPTHELNANRYRGWNAANKGLNSAMVEKLKRDAISAEPVRKNVETEEDRERRFRIETSKRLGERKGTGGLGGVGGINGLSKPPPPPVISKTPLPLPSRPTQTTKPKTTGPPQLSQLTKRWLPGSAAPAASSSSSSTAAKPQGISKNTTSPHTKPSSTTTLTNASSSSSSAFMSQLKKLSNSSTSPPPKRKRDELFDEDGEEDNEQETTKKDQSTRPQQPPQKKLIPIQRPKREPSLFHVKKPVRSNTATRTRA